MKKKNKPDGSSNIKASIDLHGKTVEEAERIVDQFLVRISDLQGGRAKIVVGKGTGTLLKFVTGYLRQAGYHFEFEKLSNGKPNEGVLILFL